MAQFHTLTVTNIRKTTRDAVIVSLTADEPDMFDFMQGQYLTFRHNIDGTELRRSYSICAGRDDDTLQVGIKKVAGGAFSTWANDVLKPGDKLEAMPPMGTFHTPLDPAATQHYLGFAGGSGITPVLSILRTVLIREPHSTFTLVYVNRAVNTIMFREELEDLKNRYMGRLNIIHILGQDAQGIDLFTGRLDTAKCTELFERWIPIDRITTAFICGPEPMMHEIVSALKTHGMADPQIKYELFGSRKTPPTPRNTQLTAKHPQSTSVTLTLDGETRQFDMPRDLRVLDAALLNDVDAPFACRAGVCSTCRAKVTEGVVEMVQNHALEDGEVARGYVLTCQSIALTDTLTLTYDDH
jgi:ring-1,2-phenylacetyl-CoA epoxidase subunit PaaE